MWSHRKPQLSRSSGNISSQWPHSWPQSSGPNGHRFPVWSHSQPQWSRCNGNISSWGSHSYVQPNGPPMNVSVGWSQYLMMVKICSHWRLGEFAKRIPTMENSGDVACRPVCQLMHWHSGPISASMVIPWASSHRVLLPNHPGHRIPHSRALFGCATWRPPWETVPSFWHLKHPGSSLWCSLAMTRFIWVFFIFFSILPWFSFS